MKRLHRPIRHCLTTAVVTSAMLEAYALPLMGAAPEVSPAQATGQEHSVSETNATSPDSAAAIAPPEVTQPSDDSKTDSSVAAQDGKPSSDAGQPNPSNSAVAPSESSTPSSSASTPEAENNQIEPTAAPESTPAENTASEDTASEQATDRSTELDAARQLVSEKLAELVEQDREGRLAQLQQNLVASALHYARTGELEQARETAQHPVLSAEVQAELLTQIDAIAAQLEEETEPAIAAEPTTVAEAVTLPSLPGSYLALPPNASFVNPYAGNQCLTVVSQASDAASPVPKPTADAADGISQSLPTLQLISSAAADAIKQLQVSRPETIVTLPETATRSEASELTALAVVSSTPSFESPSDSSAVEKQPIDFKLNRMVGASLAKPLQAAGIRMPVALPMALQSVFDWTIAQPDSNSSPIKPTDSNPKQQQTGYYIHSGVTISSDLEIADVQHPAGFLHSDQSSPLVAESLQESLRESLPGEPAYLSHLKQFGKVENSSKSDEDSDPVSLGAIPVAFTQTAEQTQTATLPCAAIAQGDLSTDYSATSLLARQFGRMGIRFPLPIPAAITSAFGWRIHPISGDRRFHTGVDFGAPMGTPVLAATSGQVAVADYMGGYGLTVIVEQPETAQRNLYAHLSGIAVQPGTWVEQGTVIGWVGSTGNSTGPHLHFESQLLTANGWTAIDPVAAAIAAAQR